MKPVNIGGHPAYQDRVLTQLHKYYPDADTSFDTSTWEVMEQFWSLDLSPVDQIMQDRYSVFGPEPRLPSDMMRSYLLLEPEPSAHQVRGGVSPRIDQTHAHGEHERMSYAEIIPQDHVSKEEKELLFVSGMMDPQPDHGVAENHGDDGQGLQQFKILLSCALYFRSHHVVFSAAALPPA